MKSSRFSTAAILAFVFCIAIESISAVPLKNTHELETNLNKDLSCFGDVSVVLDPIPDAEDQIFTSDGRYFVTGGRNVYQVIRDTNNQLVATPAYDRSGSIGLTYFIGITELYNTIYTTYYTGRTAHLTAASLNSTNPTFSIIYNLPTVFTNGVAADPIGKALYLADTLASTISLVRVDPNNPLRVVEYRVVLTEVINGPNAIKHFDGVLYITNPTTLYTTSILRDGSLTTPTILFQLDGGGVLDELTFINDGQYIAIANYPGDQILILDRLRGNIICDSGPIFQSPSSVLVSQYPFELGKLVVTEKGVLGDMDGPRGNRVVQVDFQIIV
eukprot:TRINITY_DN4024_c0_g1_i2.p1 TRINITY_DN4024_c0_g1~~TRINITY_DN4024_c0_g1_i2.p1  ORF type:complete len:330 (-),score=59.29 TRINITY_DN4024_c0_g1_i2:99-1088(-)